MPATQKMTSGFALQVAKKQLEFPVADEHAVDCPTPRLHWAKEAVPARMRERTQSPVQVRSRRGYPGGDDADDEPAPDYAWMRMRTPSPERVCSRWEGEAPLSLPEAALASPYMAGTPATFEMQQPYFVQQQFMQTTPYGMQPMMCFVPVSPTNSVNDMRKNSSMQSMQSSQFSGGNEDRASSEASEASEVVITAENAPSLGSINHPHSCGASCKYFWKQRGCKDGANCSHCHVCVYRHNKHRKSGRDKEAIRDRTATESTATTRCSITSEMSALPEAGECVECFGEL